MPFWCLRDIIILCIWDSRKKITRAANFFELAVESVFRTGYQRNKIQRSEMAHFLKGSTTSVKTHDEITLCM